MPEEVILVDSADRENGTMEKLAAHQEGRLHRAISVFIFNSQGELLLQRRAEGKYHSSGLWTNTCCSHPRPGEETADAASRRLKEEMGISAPLEKLYAFIYKAPVGNELCEHEYDHVFFGKSDAVPQPDPAEAMEWKWAAVADIAAEMDASPSSYTIWFQLIFKDVAARVASKF